MKKHNHMMTCRRAGCTTCCPESERIDMEALLRICIVTLVNGLRDSRIGRAEVTAKPKRQPLRAKTRPFDMPTAEYRRQKSLSRMMAEV